MSRQCVENFKGFGFPEPSDECFIPGRALYEQHKLPTLLVCHKYDHMYNGDNKYYHYISCNDIIQKFFISQDIENCSFAISMVDNEKTQMMAKLDAQKKTIETLKAELDAHKKIIQSLKETTVSTLNTTSK
jgi:hypothetical protein